MHSAELSRIAQVFNKLPSEYDVVILFFNERFGNRNLDVVERISMPFALAAARSHL
jgi:hypothetical protein